MRRFTKNVRKQIDPFLDSRGFHYFEHRYVLEQPNGVRLMITFDNSGIDNNSFGIMVLVNSVELDGRNGAHCVRFFTGGSLSRSRRKLPCHNIDALNGRLERFKDQYDVVLAPYFALFESCADIATKLSNDPNLSSYVGDLYFQAGRKRQARKAYEAYIERLPTMKHVKEDKIVEAVAKTKVKIKKCGFFSRI